MCGHFIHANICAVSIIHSLVSAAVTSCVTAAVATLSEI